MRLRNTLNKRKEKYQLTLITFFWWQG